MGAEAENKLVVPQDKWDTITDGGTGQGKINTTK